MKIFICTAPYLCLQRGLTEKCKSVGLLLDYPYE